MDPLILNYGLTAVGAVLMALLKRQIDQKDKEMEGLRKDIEHLKETRLHKEDFINFKSDIQDMFKEIKQDLRELRNAN